MGVQLERISVKTRAIETFTLPDFPKMPQWVVRKFDLVEYEAQVELWRRNAQQGIRDALRSIQAQSPSG